MLNLARANLSNDLLHIAISNCVKQASVRKHANDHARGYLGAPLIGDECLRCKMCRHREKCLRYE